MTAPPGGVALALGVALLAGCLGGPDAAGDAAACLPSPHPCGQAWPADLDGPFALAPGMPQRVEVASHDGTLLGGWLFLPGLPDGVGAPVLLVSSPYHGLAQGPPAGGAGGAGDVARYVEEGYAVAAFSVRGTGISGGCFANKGLAEQLDQVALVEWLAAQPWSNGRVAMGGTSYPGTTPFMAANLGAAGLVTLLPNGPVTDPYTELHTPQGALYTMGGPYEAGRRGLVTAAPLAGLEPRDGLLPAHLDVAPERLCPDLAQVLLGAELGHLADDRDGAFWRERQLVLGFPNVTAAVFLSHGLQETAHPYQEDVAWESLRSAPKRMLLGQWDHELPRVDDWQGELLAWLDYWLKGRGSPDAIGLGRVDYQDSAGAWHVSTAWPPAEAHEEALHLAGDLLGPLPGEGGMFRSVPPPPDTAPDAAREHLCGRAPPGTGLVYRTAVLERATLLAGNPFALLRLASDQPGGLVSAHLFVEDERACDEARLVSSGTADLRFHDGRFVGRDFPMGTAQDVRIDLLNLAEPLAAGDVLALVLSFGDTFSTGEVADPLTDARFSRSGQPYLPEITVHEGSHLVLPVVGPRLGGVDPWYVYPPRPFTP